MNDSKEIPFSGTNSSDTWEFTENMIAHTQGLNKTCTIIQNYSMHKVKWTENFIPSQEATCN